VTTILLRGGTVVGETSSSRGDVLIKDGRLSEVGDSLAVPKGATVIDAEGCWVGPGFVDLHAHLREPGREEAETIDSGARAAAVGGYSAIVAMPNTEPALDNAALVAYVLARGATTPIDVAVAGAITQGRLGSHLAPLAEMAALGVRLFTDDGIGVQDPAVMRRALSYAKPLDVRLAQHCEDEQLAAGGTMNEGPWSSRLGLVGPPARRCSTRCSPGYQEVITDPSYAGQRSSPSPIPTSATTGSTRPTTRRPAPLPRRRRAGPGRPAQQLAVDGQPRGVPRPHGVPGITGVDTRRLTRHLRDRGAMPCAFGTAPVADLRPPPRRPRPPTGGTWCRR
jgi:hypothetical protein